MGEITWKTEGDRARTYVENRWNNKANCQLKKRFMLKLAELVPPPTAASPHATNSQDTTANHEEAE
jgi:hypothetical protein